MPPMYLVSSETGSSYGEQPRVMAKDCTVWDGTENP